MSITAVKSENNKDRNNNNKTNKKQKTNKQKKSKGKIKTTTPTIKTLCQYIFSRC
jgi:hypothetical protein